MIPSTHLSMPKPNYNITSIAHATTHDYMDDQKGLIQSGKTAACDIITHRCPGPTPRTTAHARHPAYDQ